MPTNNGLVRTAAPLSKRLLDLKRLLERVDGRMARVFLPWVLQHPPFLPAFLRLLQSHERARQARAEALGRGLTVPPFLVLSVTSRCNLRCAGCFAGVGCRSLPEQPEPALVLEEWREIIRQGIELGVIGFIIAGGEPFLVPGLSSLFREFRDRLFLVFTNGTALRAPDFNALENCCNTAVIVSLEGDRELTDARRGAGVYDSASDCLKRLRKAGTMTGFAVTVTSANAGYWMKPQNLDKYMRRSSRLAFFMEYIPVAEGDSRLRLNPEERSGFRKAIAEYRENRNVFLIHSPVDEAALGGCVSAGRGFAHVNPAGDVTACPVSNLATHNLKTSTLEQALASSLFKLIRDDEGLLETEEHPCALFAHARELERLGEGVGAYRCAPIIAL